MSSQQPNETSSPVQPPNERRRKSRRLFLLLGILFLCLAWLVYVFETPGRRPVLIYPYEPAILTPDENTHDLGVIKTDDKISHSFYIYNIGGKHLRITKVDASCGCTVAKISKTVIGPGDFARLDVTLDTSTKLGNVRKTITIHSNDPKYPEYQLSLTGNVVYRMQGHQRLKVKDPLVLFKGECAKCHVTAGRGKVGQDLFLADCAMCHGVDGKGKQDIGPNLISTHFEESGYTAKVRRVIADGSPHNPEMPPFASMHGGPLNDAEITSLVNFLKYKSLHPTPTE